MAAEAADRAADHRVGLAALHHQRCDRRIARAYDRLGVFRRHALALHDRMIERPVFLEPPVPLGIDQLEIDAGAQPQAITLDASGDRSEEHTSELQSLMRISYAVFCLKKKKTRQVYQNEKDYQRLIL